MQYLNSTDSNPMLLISKSDLKQLVREVVAELNSDSITETYSTQKVMELTGHTNKTLLRLVRKGILTRGGSSRAYRWDADKVQEYLSKSNVKPVQKKVNEFAEALTYKRPVRRLTA